MVAYCWPRHRVWGSQSELAFQISELSKEQNIAGFLCTGPSWASALTTAQLTASYQKIMIDGPTFGVLNDHSIYNDKPMQEHMHKVKLFAGFVLSFG